MESAALPILQLLPFSQTLKPSSNPNLHGRFQTLRPTFSAGNTTIFSNFDPLISFASNILRRSPLPTPSSRGLASISCAAALSGSSGGGGDGLAGGAGGGGDGGSSGGETGSRSLAVGESEEVSDLGSDDVIILTVGGMSCGGCAASVKRILESQPQVSSATVDLEKETAVVWAVPEVKVTENWQKQLGEKLANHLTTCGFKSNLQGEGHAVQGEIQS